jgi:myo-inositol-1(or 4)-monophosphatase
MEGAGVIRASSGGVGEVRTKSSPTDPVTALDLEVERIIWEALSRRTPGASFLGEEQGVTLGRSELGWILDPIDGTVNLTYGLPVIGISLAATVGGDVVAGAVLDVLRDEVFSAARGRGARLGGVPIGPSRAGDLSKALVATGFAYSARARALEARYFGQVLPAARDVRCFGSSALHLCWVACGRLDGFYQRDMKRWDFAAGGLIALESGACVQPPSRENGQLMVAASPRVFDRLVALVS